MTTPSRDDRPTTGRCAVPPQPRRRRPPRGGWGAALATAAVCGLVACGGGDGDGDSGSSPPPATAAATQSKDCAARRSVPGADVFLLAGQSNMAGYGAYYVAGFDTPDPRVKQFTRAGVVAPATEPLDHPNFPFNAGRIGPGLSFGKAYAAGLPSHRTVLLVPAAQGGSGFSDRRWNPGDDLFEQAVERTRAALALDAANCFGGILWSQGEREALDGVPGPTYRTALHAAIRSFRSRIGGNDGGTATPFVLSRFSPDWAGPVPTPAQKAILDVIDTVPTELAYTAVVSTNGLTSNLTQGLDGAIHLDAASQRIFGVRYHEGLKAALALTTPR